MPEPLSKERIVDDFVHGTQQIQHVSEHHVMAGWNYELQLGMWLERVYRANGPDVTGHEDLTNALQSILDDEDLDNSTRFSAAYCLAIPRARSDAAYGKRMRFEPKHEDELSLAKIELSSLSSTRIEEQLDESREETTEMMSRELQRSRGEVLQLLGLIGVILAFLSLGINTSLKIDEPLIRHRWRHTDHRSLSVLAVDAC